MTECEDRLALRGVGRVGFYNGSDQTPEDIPFPSCLAAALRFIGEDYSWTTFTEKGKTRHRNDLYIELLGRRVRPSACAGRTDGIRTQPT